MKGFSRLILAAPLLICATLAQSEVPPGIRGNVTVQNDSNNPVPVKGEVTIDSTTPISVQGEVSLAAPNSFLESLNAIISGGGTNASSLTNFDVPEGSIAVVEHVSANCSTPAGNRVFVLRLARRDSLQSGGTIVRNLLDLPLSLQGKPVFSENEFYVSSGPFKAYVGNCEDCVSSSIGLEIGRESPDSDSTQCNVTLSGYFVTP